MSIPKGYKYNKKLSEATEADVLKWADFTVTNSALMTEVDGFGKELDKLVKMFETKCNLSELQASHVQVKEEFQDLKNNIADNIDTIPARLKDLKSKYEGLLDTLEPVEKLFGTTEEFECVNKAGETKTISQLLAGKSHLLL